MFNGRVDMWYGIKNYNEKLLKLESLESGFDSLQIRIWYEYSLVLYRDLVIIKCTNDVWTARHYHMKLKWDPNDNPVTFTSVKIEDVAPKSGWPQFINKLSELGIMTLPNMDDISNLQHGYEDGVTYNIEVATKKQYRFYGYYLPQEFANKFWQAKSMTEILSLISSELNIKAAF